MTELCNILKEILLTLKELVEILKTKPTSRKGGTEK